MVAGVKGGFLEKQPSSALKVASGGWKKRFIAIKPAGGQGTDAHEAYVAWFDSEKDSRHLANSKGKMFMQTGTTLNVGATAAEGFMLRSYEGEQLRLRVPPSMPNAETANREWVQALTELLDTLPPVKTEQYDVKSRLIAAGTGGKLVGSSPRL